MHTHRYENNMKLFQSLLKYQPFLNSVSLTFPDGSISFQEVRLKVHFKEIASDAFHRVIDG